MQRSIQTTLDGQYSAIPHKEKVILLAHALGVSQEYILTHPEHLISIQIDKSVNDLFAQRESGIPLAYITGIKSFYQLDFFVSPDVLIPRPETEILVERAQEILNTCTESTSLLDIGTGSGCIAISLSHITPSLHVLATDISNYALLIAQKNKQHLTPKNTIRFRHADLLDIPAEDLSYLSQSHNLLISANLPYVSRSLYNQSKNHRDTQGILFEPKNALVSGDDGLDHFKTLFSQLHELRKYLSKKVVVLAEYLGDEIQTKYFTDTLPSLLSGASVSLHKDLSGRNRIAEVTFSEKH